MSAMPSMATESVRRNEPTRGAKSRRLRGHSITPSARNTIDGGTVRAGALAVLAFSTVTALYWQVSFAR